MLAYIIISLFYFALRSKARLGKRESGAEFSTIHTPRGAGARSSLSGRENGPLAVSAEDHIITIITIIIIIIAMTMFMMLSS